MWSTFEKLKDSVTQIASDVLDSQDLDGEGAFHDGSLEAHYNGGLQDVHLDDDGSPEFLPSEMGYYKEKGDELQTEVENAMRKYAGMLEEKETEVSLLREENRLLKEQFLINSTKLDALLNERNSKVDTLLSGNEDPKDILCKDMQKTNGHVDALSERLEEDEVLVEKTDTELGKVEDRNIIANGYDTRETEELELRSSNEIAANRSEESSLLLSEVEADVSDHTNNELESQEGSSDKESQVSRAVDEQVTSLSQRLRASEDVCCSLQTKLEDVSLERGTLAKKLEDVSLERDTLTKKLDDVSLERDTLAKKLEEVLLEPEIHSKKLEEVLLERDTLFKNVEEMTSERDKAVQNLGRLRQNLLEMESSNSEKMDNDTLRIEDLELRLKTAEDCVGQLQQALTKSQDDLAQANRNSALRSMDANGEIELLKQKLQTSTEALESKDMELANLQSALGQYYAESDAQERLEAELRAVRESNARLTRDLKIAEGTIDLKDKELETVTKKLGSADLVNEQLNHTMHKLQQEVLKLRSALEQSITSLNRMSSDSDFYVDRRIVIKLLVTYFQRHHSKEVLDLMVRMLGFSEEDKRRVGLAQQNARGGGMVRSVFGVPGRIVGGILGSSDSDTSPRAAPGDNQSFADMWIDFLLKESQERERRERGEGGSNAASPVPLSPMANLTRSMPSSPSGGHHHKPSSSFSGFPSSFLLPPKPSRVSSSTDLQTILTGESTLDDASS